jgi:hypothetical protein
MRPGLPILPLLVWLALQGSLFVARGELRQVPNPWPTIQAALDASQSGDTVLVEPGDHAGPVDFLGRDVRVVSRLGAAQTRILASGSGPIVRLVNGEGPGAQLEGFTLSGGVATPEDGVCGGALRVESAAPLIRGNIFRGNQAVLGGGVCLLGSGAWLIDNLFEDNQAEMGGGLYVEGGEPLLQRNLFNGNRALGAGYGGGAALESSGARVERNRFIANQARLGGALSLRGTSPVDTLRLQRNSAWGNSALFGGAYYAAYCSPVLEGEVLTHSTQGAGLWCNGATPALRCCDLFANLDGNDLCGTDLGGNLSADPLFCDPAAADLRLATGSPCWSTACGVIGAYDLDCAGLDVEEGPAARPQSLWLDPAVPNPFNPATSLTVTLAQTGSASLKVFDMAGREVATLFNGLQAAGTQSVQFRADGLPSGVYFAVLSSGQGVQTQKLLLIK